MELRLRMQLWHYRWHYRLRHCECSLGFFQYIVLHLHLHLRTHRLVLQKGEIGRTRNQYGGPHEESVGSGKNVGGTQQETPAVTSHNGSDSAVDAITGAAESNSTGQARLNGCALRAAFAKTAGFDDIGGHSAYVLRQEVLRHDIGLNVDLTLHIEANGFRHLFHFLSTLDLGADTQAHHITTGVSDLRVVSFLVTGKEAVPKVCVGLEFCAQGSIFHIHDPPTFSSQNAAGGGIPFLFRSTCSSRRTSR